MQNAPCKDLCRPNAASTHKAKATVSEVQASIIVIHPSLQVLESLANALRSKDYLAYCFATIAEAMRACEQERITILLVDDVLVSKDPQVSEWLLSVKAPALRILMGSCQDEAATCFDDVVPNPVDLHYLFTVLEKHLANWRRRLQGLSAAKRDLRLNQRFLGPPGNVSLTMSNKVTLCVSWDHEHLVISFRGKVNGQKMVSFAIDLSPGRIFRLMITLGVLSLIAKMLQMAYALIQH